VIAPLWRPCTRRSLRSLECASARKMRARARFLRAIRPQAFYSGVVKLGWLATIVVCASCAPAAATKLPDAPRIELSSGSGEAFDLSGAVQSAPLTVLVFFSTHCQCLDAHGARLRALYAEYRPRGVQFYMVDSESGASPERDEAEARRRGYPFPVLVDRGARVAGLLSAEYASYSVVLDRGARIRYAGAIDSDRIQLRDTATPHLKNALDDLLAGRNPRVAEVEALGCTLEKW